MENEQVFRYILILGLVIVLPIGFFHRFRSQSTGEKLDRRQEGLFILVTLRPIGALRMLGILCYVINPQWMSWSTITIPFWLRCTGVAIGIVSGTLVIIVFRTIGRNITDTVVTRKVHILITHGPYRWVRHPFYVAFFGVIVADSLVTANWFLGLTGVVCALLIIRRTTIEENKLIERFGDDYRAYREKTGKFFPRIRVRSN